VPVFVPPERLEAFTTLQTLASAPRLAGGDYGEVGRCIKRCVSTDSNVAVIAAAIDAAEALAKGLRREWRPEARLLTMPLLDKLKDKTTNVIRAIHGALSAFHAHCYGLGDILEDVGLALAHKVPKVQTETLKWLTAALACLDGPALAKLAPGLLPLLLKCTDDATLAVRDGALLALHAWAQRASDHGPVAKALEGLDAARKKRLAELVAAPGQGGAAQEASGASRATAAPSKPPAAASAAASDAAPAGRRPTTGGGAASRASGTSAPSGTSGRLAVSDDADLDDSGGPSAEEVGALVDEAVGGGLVGRLSSPDWKERLQGVSDLLAALGTKSDDEKAGLTEAVLRQLGYAPGWGDSNLQVVARSLEVVALLAATSPGFTRRHAVIVMTPVVDKIADVKLKAAASEALSSCAKALGHRFVTAQLARRAAAHRNPKVLEVALTWVAGELESAGGAAFEPTGVIEFGKTALSNTNPAVKAAAVKLMGLAHARYGPLVANAVTALKPALVTTLQAEFARCPFQGPAPAPAAAPPPLSASQLAPARAAPVSEAPAVALDGGARASSEQLLVDLDAAPREDVSSKITAKLVKDLGSAAWKERQAALDAVDGVVNSAGRRISPASLGMDLMPALRGRLTDSNKMLTIQALGTIALLAEACGLGPATERAFRPVYPELLKCWADPKKQVREAVSKALSAYAATQALERILPHVAAGVAEPKAPMDAKREALLWMAVAVKAAPEQCDLGPALSAAATGLLDKSIDIRDAAAVLCAALAAVATEEGCQRAMRTLSREAQAALSERLGQLVRPAASAQPPQPPPLAAEDSVAGRSSRPGTAGASGARPSTTSGAASRPTTAGSGAAGRTSVARPSGLVPPLTGPLILPCPPERKDERVSKLPRKALGIVSGKDLASDVRDSAAAEELHAQLGAYVRSDLVALLMSDDFKKHITAVEDLEGAVASQLDDVVSIMDLLLRWSVARLCELAPNTSSLLRVLQWLTSLFDALARAGLKLREEEAVLLLPVVMDKCGHNLPAVRERFRKIMQASLAVYPVPKCAALLGLALNSKNTRSRVECLEELGAIVTAHGFEPIERSGARILPTIVALAGERDAAARKAAADTLVTCYKATGEALWRHCGSLTEAQQQLLDGLFRKLQRTGSSAPAAAASAAPAAAPAQRAPPPTAQQLSTPTRLDARPPADLQSSALEVVGTTPVAPAGASGAATLTAWSSGLQTLEDGSASDEQAIGVFKVIANTLMDLSSVDDSVVATFVADADRLAALLARLASRMFATACGSSQQPAPSRGCKYVLNALAAMFGVPRMAQAVAEPTMRVAMGELLLLLLDDRVAGIAEGPALVRSLNVLMLRILEHASRTASFVALLLMLRQPPAALAGPAGAERRVRFFDLAVKCLIKLTKTLGQSLVGLDVSEVLLTVHSFFMVLGVDEIRRRGAEDDRPLRMVKTVLYELTKALGPAIKGHMQKIPPPTFEPAPIIYAYIDLNLQSLAAQPQALGSAADEPQVGGGQAAGTPARVSSGSAGAPSTPGTSDPQRVLLAGIFRKIGDKLTSLEGIEELYDFKQEHPAIDIQPHIAKTSDAFQLYIQRGLAQVEGRRAGEQQAPLPAAGGKSATEQYAERLQKVKAQQATAVAAGEAQQPAGTAAASSRQNLDALRERMRTVAALSAAATTSVAANVPPAAIPPPAAAAPAVVVASAPVPVAAPEVAAPVSSATSSSVVEDLHARLARIREMSKAASKAA
jgi:cytoskeleton-associated protein 5